MDNQLVFIIGFVIITLIALVVSLTLKFERRDNDHHKEEDTEVIRVSENQFRISQLARATQPYNPTVSTGVDGLAPHVDADGRTKLTYSRSGTGNNISFNSSEEYANLDSINSLFSHKPYIKMDWAGNSVLALNNIVTNVYGSSSQGSIVGGEADPSTYLKIKHMTVGGSAIKTITATKNGIELRLIKKNNMIYFHQFNPNDLEKYHFDINSEGILTDGSGNEVEAIYNSTKAISLGNDGDHRNRLVAVSSGGGNFQLMFVNIPDYENANEKNINRLEYFGITTGTNFPLSINSLKGFTFGDDHKVVPFEQFLGSLVNGFNDEIRRFGLFAKTHTTAPALTPSTTDPSGYVGFKGTEPNIRISFIDSLPNGTKSLQSLWGETEVTHPQPKYSIYVVLDNNIYDTANLSITFEDINNVKGTQTIVIFGSRYFSSNGHADYGTSLARDHPNITNVLNNDNLVDNSYNNNTNGFILTNDNPIYLGHGAYNMNGIVFMKFNTSGDASNKSFTVGFGTDDVHPEDQGWTYTQNQNTVNEALDLIPVFYNSVNPSVSLTTQHFRNYYHWDNVTATYTHYKYKGNQEGTAGWVVV